jgi:hypothetical protein
MLRPFPLAHSRAASSTCSAGIGRLLGVSAPDCVTAVMLRLAASLPAELGHTCPRGTVDVSRTRASLLTPIGRLSELSEPNNRPRVRDMPDGEWLTYTEAAKRLRTTPDAIRQRVKRGQMRGSRGNDGRPRVWIDARPNGQTTEQSPDRSPAGPNRTESELSGHLKALEDHVETLKGQLAAERQGREQDRVDYAAELQRIRDELERERLEVNHWRSATEHERERAHALFLHDKDLSDRLDRLHRERAAELARRWWHRLLRR